MSRALRVLIADADAATRHSARALLLGLGPRLAVRVSGEVADGVGALEAIAQGGVDVLLADLDLPRMDGIELLRHLAGREGRPAVVPMARAEPARNAALAALGLPVLTKPLTTQGVMHAVQNARKPPAEAAEGLRALQRGPRHFLSCVERGKIRLVPIEEVSYLRAELKYVTAHTPRRDYLLDASLTQLEQEFHDRFLRVHRNCLVARQWIAGFERAHDAHGEPHWLVKLQGSSERLPVSRRQWPVVRGAAVAF